MDRMQSSRSKVAIYVRVSTADQHVESQLYDLRELAVQRGLDVVQEYYSLAGRQASPPKRYGSGCRRGVAEIHKLGVELLLTRLRFRPDAGPGRPLVLPTMELVPVQRRVRSRPVELKPECASAPGMVAVVL